MGDQILLESKVYNLYLHASKLQFQGAKEINAATEKGSWRVIPFASYVPDSDDYLKV